jgi:fatty acid-binding protein DegV
MFLGWQVLAAARIRDTGVDRKIFAHVWAVRARLVQIETMRSLENLQTGGRIGVAAKWVGSLFNVKPVVSINHQTGRVTPADLARMHKGMGNMFNRKFFGGLEEGQGMRVAVLH